MMLRGLPKWRSMGILRGRTKSAEHPSYNETSRYRHMDRQVERDRATCRHGDVEMELETEIFMEI